MADTKITALAVITTVDPANDVLPIVDVSNNSMAASGTTCRVTTNQLLGAGGTATLASATISGDLTVRTNKLAVTSTGVGIGTASPSVRMELSVADAAEGARLTASSAWLRFFPYLDATDKTKIQAVNGTNTALSDLTLEGLGLRFNTNAGLSYAISNASVHTWQNVGGVAGTAMTLNSTGLGVGGSPSYKLDVTDNSTNIQARLNSSNNNGTSLRFVNTGTSGRTWQIGTGFAVTAGNFEIYDVTAAVNRLSIDSSGNVGIGVTPSYLLHTAVASGANRNIARFQVTGASNGLTITWNHATTKMIVNFSDLPTSSAGLASGDLWIDTTAGNTLKVA